MEKVNWTDLVNLAKNGDESSFDRLYKETEQKAYFIAISIVKNEEDALDVLQNAYTKAFSKINTLQEPEKFQGWLNRIISNECNTFLRRKKDTLFTELENDDIEDFSDTLENDNLEFSPEDGMDYTETKHIVKEILDGLPEEQRLVVLMRFYEQMEIKEIAEILECPEKTVRSRLTYAYNKIKTEVEKIEKRGVKLHTITTVPAIMWLLKQFATDISVPQTVTSTLTNSIAAVNTASGAATAAAHVSANVAAKATASTVAKTATSVVSKKIVAGVAAAVIAVGSGVGVKRALDSRNIPEPTTTVTEQTIVETEPETTEPIVFTKEEVEAKLEETHQFFLRYLYGSDYVPVVEEEGIEFWKGFDPNGIEYEGVYYQPMQDFETYEDFMAELRHYFTEEAAIDIAEKMGLLDYEGKCYSHAIEGLGYYYFNPECVFVSKEDNVYHCEFRYEIEENSLYTDYIDGYVVDGELVFDSASFYDSYK